MRRSAVWRGRRLLEQSEDHGDPEPCEGDRGDDGEAVKEVAPEIQEGLVLLDHCNLDVYPL